MINGRSTNELNHTNGNGQETMSPFFQPPPSMQPNESPPMGFNGAFDQQEAIRRRNLTLANPGSPNTGTHGSRVLVPETSSPQGPAGGFLPPGYPMPQNNMSSGTPPIYLPPKSQGQPQNTWQPPTQNWNANQQGGHSGLQLPGPQMQQQQQFQQMQNNGYQNGQQPRGKLTKLGDLDCSSSFNAGSASPAMSQGSATSSAAPQSSGPTAAVGALDLESSPMPGNRKRKAEDDEPEQSSPDANAPRQLSRLQRGPGAAAETQQPTQSPAAGLKIPVQQYQAYKGAFNVLSQQQIEKAWELCDGDVAKTTGQLTTWANQVRQQQRDMMFRPGGQSPATVVKSQSPMPPGANYAAYQQQQAAQQQQSHQQQAKFYNQPNAQQQQQRPPQQQPPQQHSPSMYPPQQQQTPTLQQLEQSMLQIRNLTPDQFAKLTPQYQQHVQLITQQYNHMRQQQQQQQQNMQQQPQNSQQQAMWRNPGQLQRPGPQMYQAPIVTTRVVQGYPQPGMQGHPGQGYPPQGYSQQAYQQFSQQQRQSTGPKTQSSKLVAAHKPAMAKKKRRMDSDDESEDQDYGGSSDGEQYEDKDMLQRELNALTFFNNCRAEELPDYTGKQI